MRKLVYSCKVANGVLSEWLGQDVGVVVGAKEKYLGGGSKSGHL